MLTQHSPKSCFEKISQERRLWPPSQADVVFRFRNSAIQQSLPKGGWNSPAPMGHPRAHHLGEDASAHAPTPLSEVALACGFSDQSHFTRYFSALVGINPRVWRRSVGG